MRKFPILFIISSLLLSCGCTDAGTNGGTPMNETITMEATLKPIGPSKEFTLEDYILSANSLLDAVLDSYQIMTDLAASDTAPKKGVKAAKKVTEKHLTRIEELKTADFSTWSAEDLSALSLELSDMISDIREVRDLLNE